MDARIRIVQFEFDRTSVQGHLGDNIGQVVAHRIHSAQSVLLIPHEDTENSANLVVGGPYQLMRKDVGHRTRLLVRSPVISDVHHAIRPAGGTGDADAVSTMMRATRFDLDLIARRDSMKRRQPQVDEHRLDRRPAARRLVGSFSRIESCHGQDAFHPSRRTRDHDIAVLLRDARLDRVRVGGNRVTRRQSHGSIRGLDAGLDAGELVASRCGAGRSDGQDTLPSSTGTRHVDVAERLGIARLDPVRASRDHMPPRQIHRSKRRHDGGGTAGQLLTSCWAAGRLDGQDTSHPATRTRDIDAAEHSGIARLDRVRIGRDHMPPRQIHGGASRHDGRRTSHRLVGSCRGG